MSRPDVLHVIGARPNYMKVAPIHAALEGRVTQSLIHTGQHYDRLLSDVFLEYLPLPRPDVMLDVGSGSQAAQTARALVAVEEALVDLRPRLVLVAGDVNSTLAAALAAAKLELPVCHVEAGLRSFDRSMPEEHNRRLTDHLSSLLLAHSDSAVANLEAEGIAGEAVQLVGNTMIDSLLRGLDAARERAAYRDYGLEPGAYVLVTLHRPRLVDDADLLGRTLRALGEVASSLPVVFPAHPRTTGRIARVRARGPFGRAHGRAASVPRLRLARASRRGRRDRFGRRAGRDDRPRRPVLHAARQHRAPGHGDPRHERAARSRAGTPRRHSPPARAACRRRPGPRRSGTGRQAARAAREIERFLSALP